MSEWRENIERVLAGPGRLSSEQRAALAALTAQIEEIQRDSAYSALAATVLTAQIEELERERDAMRPVFDAALGMANARVGEEDERLDALWDTLAALAQSDPPEDSE